MGTMLQMFRWGGVSGKDAPLRLWLRKLLNAKLGSTWSQSTLTIFADDKLLCWQIGSERDLDQALREVGVVLATLQELGMKVSNSKSEAALALKGSEADAVRKRLVVKWNGQTCLRVGRSQNTAYIPIKSEISYLGIQLSYGSYELQSARHRRQLAKAAFARLHRVLRKGAVLSKAAKLRIYRACVWPALVYGLPGLGLDNRALDCVCSTAAMQLRKILRLYTNTALPTSLSLSKRACIRRMSFSSMSPLSATSMTQAGDLQSRRVSR